jgi:Lrp/AsnC family transcriptional regulator for asnA, asnC and gidA
MGNQQKLDNIDKQILRYLTQDARTPYTDIARELQLSPGTIHVRVKKMEQMGIIRGTSLQVDYARLGYSFIAYIGLYLSSSNRTMEVIDALKAIPEITVANLATGRFGIFCKMRCRDALHAKEVIFQINAIDGVVNTETMISLEECINSNARLIEAIMKEG